MILEYAFFKVHVSVTLSDLLKLYHQSLYQYNTETFQTAKHVSC